MFLLSFLLFRAIFDDTSVSGSAFIPCIILLPLHSETSLNELVNGC